MQIGIDLGGTKTEIVVLDQKGDERFRKRVPTPAHEYSAVLHKLRDLVREAERAVGGPASVGVASPGALSPETGLMRNSNTLCLNGKPFDRDLGAVLGRPVRVENDANCFALSEAIDGAGSDAVVVFGVIIGTGTGGGIVVHKERLLGRNAIAGEWGHTPLPWPRDAERPGPECYCGRRGCVETFLSGPGLARDHQPDGAIGGPEIAELARQGDAAAQQTLERYSDRMARSLACVINVLDPDVIVMGGGVSQLDCIYRDVPPALPRYVFSDYVRTQIRKAQHGASSGVRGAAWLWNEPAAAERARS